MKHKSSKEDRATKASINRMLQAEAATAIKAPPVMTFSAQMPAYTYTCLCPDRRMRKPPKKRGAWLGGQGKTS